MQMSSSAKRTCSACSSASEYTATVLIPSSRQAWMTRSAISPRLAIRIFLNMASGRLDREQALAVLDGLPVLDIRLYEFPIGFGSDLVHQLHRLDDAQDLPLLDLPAGFDECLGARLRRSVERADDRRLDDSEIDILVDRREHRLSDRLR